jgi:uncharacterized membrane protein
LESRLEIGRPKLLERKDSYLFKEKLFFILILIFFILFFIPGMSRSLWIDETITYWIVKDGLRELFYRAIHYQGQSPFYYFIVWCFIQIFGNAEWILRLPSLLSLIITCIILYKLGLFFFNREGGLIATLGFINLWPVIVVSIGGSCSARPYELAVMLSVLSILCFVWWVKTARVIYHVAYITASVATCYAHILFAPILFVHFCYVLISTKSRSNVSFGKLFLTFGLVVMCILPNSYQLMLLYQKKELYSLSIMPTVINLMNTWFPRVLLTPLIAAFVIVWIIKKKMYWRRTTLFSKRFLFFLIWFLFPALFWFITSTISGTSVFLLRYYCWAFPALSLIIAGLIIAMESEGSRVIAVIVFSVLMTYINISNPKPLEDWRAATSYINSMNISNRALTLVWPGLMEQRDWDWSTMPENQKYLLAPFSFYSMKKKVILLPLIPDKITLKGLLAEHDISTTPKNDDIFLMVRNIPVKEKTMQKDQASQSILENWFKRNGFSIIQKKFFGGVIVSQFVFNPAT